MISGEQVRPVIPDSASVLSSRAARAIGSDGMGDEIVKSTGMTNGSISDGRSRLSNCKRCGPLSESGGTSSLVSV